jgi:hypothetical protein
VTRNATIRSLFLGYWLIAACGKDVDLGGPAATDAAVVVVRQACDPCTSDDQCAKNAGCAVVGAHTFCVSFCDDDACEAGLTCDSVTKANGKSDTACVPTSGACAPASTTLDAGTCGTLSGPNVVASCTACDRGSSDCQQNGCYGAWWCNTASRDCVPPPASCP